MMILFERHATSEDNERKVASGHLDPPLSPKGRMQAADLGQRYANKLPSVVLCSDLKRSYETAQIAFPAVRRVQSPLLREWDYGIYNGKPAEEVEALKADFVREPFPGGESLEEAVERVLGFLDLQQANLLMFIGHRSGYYALEHRYKQRTLESLVKAPWTWQPGWVYS
jgi:broad specificity phosphatase PhoE